MYMLLNQNKMKNKIPQCQNNSKIQQKNTTMSEQFQNTTMSEQFQNPPEKYHNVRIIPKSHRKIPQCQNNSKIHQKNTTMSEQFQNPTEKSLEKVKMISNTQVHDLSLSELGTGASIKSGRVKLVLWAQISSLGEMMWSCQ